MAVTAVLTLTVVSNHHAPIWPSLAGIACVLGAWLVLIGVFADEYARLWAASGRFVFPDDDAERRFGDFFYLSIQVSTTFSSSDVQVCGHQARSAVTAHCLTVWAFSTVIVALLVSLALPT